MAAQLHILFPLADAGGFGDWFALYWGWCVWGLIVLVGLFILGFKDVIRFSLRRAWAISGVCFAESIRKRVLLLTPLAIIGVIAIAQLQHATDEQDAVRQTIKYALFSTGLVVMLSSIILACTNLPKEIESRVIYTIVTKPTTRLELILGKIIGFSRVSLAIVAIMGLFTWGYLRIREREKRAELSTRMQEGDLSPAERARAIAFEKTGLLTARAVATADGMDIFGKPPDPSSDSRIISDAAEQNVLAGFDVNINTLFGPPTPSGKIDDQASQGIGRLGMVIRIQLAYERTGEPADQPPSEMTMGPELPGAPTTRHLVPPLIAVQIYDHNGQLLLGPAKLVAASTITALQANIGAFVASLKVPPRAGANQIRLSEPTRLRDGAEGQFAYVWIPPDQAKALFYEPQFFVVFTGFSIHVDYKVGPQPVRAFIPTTNGDQLVFDPSGATEIPPAMSHGKPMVLFRGGIGIHGEQEIKSGEIASPAVAVFHYRSSPPPLNESGRTPIEIIPTIDRTTSSDEASEDATTLDITVVDNATHQSSTQTVQVESQQPSFVDFPASTITSPDYDILIHCQTPERTFGVYPDSVKVITSRQSFEVNLIKSLSIIWMMSILVVTLAVMCSTFVSWPIAIVLTIFLLLGHWGVSQLGDSTGPGLGRRLVNDFRFSDAATSKVFSTGVDALTHTLSSVALVLPDTSQFVAIDDIEQGVSISGQRLTEALYVLAGFAIPATIFAYLILKRKEVAP